MFWSLYLFTTPFLDGPWVALLSSVSLRVACRCSVMLQQELHNTQGTGWVSQSNHQQQNWIHHTQTSHADTMIFCRCVSPSPDKPPHTGLSLGSVSTPPPGLHANRHTSLQQECPQACRSKKHDKHASLPKLSSSAWTVTLYRCPQARQHGVILLLSGLKILSWCSVNNILNKMRSYTFLLLGYIYFMSVIYFLNYFSIVKRFSFKKGYIKTLALSIYWSDKRKHIYI